MSLTLQLEKLANRFNSILETADDPSFWSLDRLNIDLFDNQVEVINAVCDLSQNYVAIVQARGAGKTFSVGLGLIKICLDYPGIHIGVFGPKAEQANRVVSEIKTRILTPSSSAYETVNWKTSTNSKLDFLNGSLILSISASEAAMQEGWHFDIVVLDECLHPDSLVTLVDGTTQTIKQIVEEKKVTHVMSYDEEIKQIVPSKILGYKTISLQKEMLEIKLKNEKTIKCTVDHKFFTRRGWIEAQHLTLQDNIAEFQKCLTCANQFLTFESTRKYCSRKCSNSRSEKLNPLRFCQVCHKKIIGKLYCNTHKHYKEHFCLLCHKLIEKRYTKSGSGYYTKCCSSKCQSILSSQRMKQNNPVYKKGVVALLRQKQTAWFYALSKEKQEQQIAAFIAAPYYRRGKMTQPEQIIQSWQISNLKYTGDGTKIITFLTGKRKNPDFYCEVLNKVVEVGDFEYWHTKTETDEVILQYKNLGIECLYLDAKHVIHVPQTIRKQVEEFLCVSNQ
jgi:hypothetical protein